VAQDRDRWRALVNGVKNLSGSGTTDLAYLVMCTPSVWTNVDALKM
jgi:hypothetical protein